MPKSYRRECLHCNELFDPNPRNRWHQKFCGKPECRKASKTESQRCWLPEPDLSVYDPQSPPPDTDSTHEES